MTEEENSKTPRLFYGWIVLAASFVVLFFNGGARFSIGVIFKPMIAEFGWTRSSISFAFFLNMALFALLFGFTFLITAPLTPMLLGRIYGLKHLGVLAGFITTIHHLAGGFWAWAGGMVFDNTGDYQLIFAISAGMAFIAFLSILFVKEKEQSTIIAHLKGE